MARRRKRRRSAPTYLSQRPGDHRIFYRYRLVAVHRDHRLVRDVFSVSEYPHDWAASLEAVRVHRAATRDALVREIDAYLDRQSAAANPTLGELAADWLTDCRDRGVQVEHTERYRVAIMLDTLGDRPAASLTADDVLDWRRRLRDDRGLSASSLNAYLVLFKMICNFAVRRGRLARSPAAVVPPLIVQRDDPATLSIAQLRAVLDALPAWQALQGARLVSRHTTPLVHGAPSNVPLEGIILTAYYTLARTRNVLTLRWDQVDLDNRQIVFPDTKNTRRSGVRVVAPMREPLCVHLWTLAASAAGPWVFPNPTTGEPFVDVRKAWHELLRIANRNLAQRDQIPPGFKLYNLRHTGASHLAASGAMSAAEIAELMGDTRIETVERRYFKLDAERIRRSLERASLDPDLHALEESLLERSTGRSNGASDSVTMADAINGRADVN